MNQTASRAHQRKSSRLRRAAAAVTLGFLGGIATGLGRTTGAQLLDWIGSLL